MFHSLVLFCNLACLQFSLFLDSPLLFTTLFTVLESTLRPVTNKFSYLEERLETILWSASSSKKI